MDDDDADISAFRLSASAAKTLTRKVKRYDKRIKKQKALDKAAKQGDQDAPIEIPSSPSPSPSPSVISIQSGASDDEFEEVAIPAESSMPQTPAVGWPHESLDVVDHDVSYLTEDEDEEGHIIRLEIGGETEADKAKALELALRKKPMTAKDRALRMEIHKMHTVCLLASAKIRNQWACDDVLKARLLSLLPHPLHAAFSISPKRFPDRAQRSRLFIEALQQLATWWSQSFFDISDETLGQRTRTWDDIQEIIDCLPPVDKWEMKGGKWARRYVEVNAPEDRKGKGKATDKKKKKKEQMMDPVMDALTKEIGGERMRSVNSLMKKCLQQEGSRDISAQLFVALARSCGLGARLVVSVQAVPWRAEKAVAKKKTGAGSGARALANRQGMGADPVSEEDELEEVPIPGVTLTSPSSSKKKSNAGRAKRTGDPADIYRLRQQRPPPQTLGTAAKPKPVKRKKELMTSQPPVFWAEVFSRSDQRWVSVDPMSGIVRKKAFYDPASDTGPVRMVYVVAYEEDGFARDVTLRYAKNFGARTCKLRPPGRPGDESDWWSGIVQFLQRPQRLNRDDLEDAELEMSQVNETMPLVMTGFKDHPLYVLERHLKQNEVIMPKREIGRFKGEAVYRRSTVLLLRTPETWMRVGRMVKERQEPLKWIKQRAVTIQKRRAQELAVQEGHEPIQQGLYAEYQTELYKPPPIENGIIPRNAFGNIDLYTPSMLPEGAMHLPYKGIAKVAKGLSISYAEAVTSFEFKRQKATPVLTGIVVAKENEDVVLEAYWKSAAAAEEKEKARRETQALKRWAKLVNGMRVRNRLRAEYGTGEELHERTTNPMALDQPARTAASIIATANQESSSTWQSLVLERMYGEYEEDVEEEDEKPQIEIEEPVEEPAASAPESTAAEPSSELSELEEEAEPEPEPEPAPPPPPVQTARPLRIRLRVNPPSVVSTPEPKSARAGRPRRGAAGPSVSNGAVPATAIPAPPPVPAPAPAPPRAAPAPRGGGKMKPRMRLPTAKPTANGASSSPAVMNTVVSTIPTPAKPKAKANGKQRAGRKRKADRESETDETDSDGGGGGAVSSRAKAVAPAPVAPTRTLRSRAPKTAQQQAEEEEKRNRMLAAMASDEDD